jgi:hypothetical protein
MSRLKRKRFARSPEGEESQQQGTRRSAYQFVRFVAFSYLATQHLSRARSKVAGLALRTASKRATGRRRTVLLAVGWMSLRDPSRLGARGVELKEWALGIEEAEMGFLRLHQITLVRRAADAVCHASTSLSS